MINISYHGGTFWRLIVVPLWDKFIYFYKHDN